MSIVPELKCGGCEKRAWPRWARTSLLLASSLLGTLACRQSDDARDPTSSPTDTESGTGADAATPGDDNELCDGYQFDAVGGVCLPVSAATCADDLEVFESFEDCAEKHAPELAEQCGQDSERPFGCPCSASAECEFECVEDLANAASPPEDTERRCRALKLGMCTKIPTPPGCYCVLGHREDDADVAESQIVCWAGIE